MSDDQRTSGKRPRTRFEPVSAREPKPAREQQPPASAPAPESAPAPTAPLPTLRALEPGEPPRYAGLHRDEREIVVGSQGAVVIQGAHRLAAFLAALSQVADLARGVAVEAHDDHRFLVLLTPSDDGQPPSQHYDTVQGALVASRLSVSRARLFVGDGHLFVPYADLAAPHGFDADGAAPARRALLRPGDAALLLEPRPVALLDMLLRVPLLPAADIPATTLTVLTDRRLAALVAGYVQRHGLAYGVRFISWRRGEHSVEAALFDIVTAGEVRPVPGFVCDFLSRLPHTMLLADVLEPADLESEPARRILIARGRRTPLALPHVQELLPAQCLLIIGEAPWGAAVYPSPTPRTTMQRLTEAVVAAPAAVALSAEPARRLHLRLELRRDGPGRGPIHGLLLDAPAIVRLQRMVRRLPAALFAHARIAIGDGVALVVAADDSELTGIPLGMPLARAEPPALLLPRGLRLLPSLPQDLLIPALGLQPDTLTVLTVSSRYEAPLAALQPLASLLALDAPAQLGRIEVRPVALPPLDLHDLEETPAPTPPLAAQTSAPQPSRERRTLAERVRDALPAATSADLNNQLRRKATELEHEQNYELAAALYTVLGDEQRAAACYQRLVHEESP